MAEQLGGGAAGTGNGNAPWIARFGLYVLERVAPWTLLSAVLVALVTGWLPFPVLSTFLALRQDVAQLTRIVQARDQTLAKFAAMQEAQVDIQRATCWNTAKTPDDQRRCYRGASPNAPDADAR